MSSFKRFLVILLCFSIYCSLQFLSLPRLWDDGVMHIDTPIDTFQLLPPNRLVHVTRFGLGHRLIRATSAYHLATSFGLPRMKNQWGSCSKDTNWRGKDGNDPFSIFPYLFGNDLWVLPTESSYQHEGKRIIVRNDVYGYIPGQIYKNFELPVQKSIYMADDGPFVEKMNSDTEFYNQLVESYRYRDEVDNFMQRHNFGQHEVIGIHIRAGNGEKTHFEWSGRGIDNEEAFSSALMQLVKILVKKLGEIRRKPPLVFIATDTPRLIPYIQKEFGNIGIKSVFLEQIRVDDDKGVTFQALAAKEDNCLKGWQAMFSDMLLLGNADVLIAARHSSFTQSLPLSRVFDTHKDEKGPHFCEVSNDATVMACFEDKKSWLFRHDETKIFQIHNTTQTDSVAGPTHKLLISLPDCETPAEMQDVVNFLREPRNMNETNILMHTYGKRGFNPKYRADKKERRDWTYFGP